MTKILLVSGHGAGDPGACSGGYVESLLAREVVAGVEAELTKFYCDTEVYPTWRDMYQDNRANNCQVKLTDYDYVLEVHFNAGGGYGTETLVSSEKTVDTYLQDNLTSQGFRNRGVKTRNDLFNLNLCRRLGVNYSLLEVCFIDTADMEVYMDNPRAIHRAIAMAIVRAWQLQEKTITPPKPVSVYRTIGSNPIVTSQGDTVGWTKRDEVISGTLDGRWLRLEEGQYIDITYCEKMYKYEVIENMYVRTTQDWHTDGTVLVSGTEVWGVPYSSGMVRVNPGYYLPIQQGGKWQLKRLTS